MRDESELTEGEVRDAIDAHRRDRMKQMAAHSTDSREKAHQRHQDKLDKAHQRHQDYMDSSNAAAMHGHKEVMKRDTHDTKRRKENDADTRKTFDVLRDRLKNHKRKNEQVEIDEKLTVGGGPVRTTTTSTGGRVFTNTPEKKKETPEPRKSTQVTSSIDKLRNRMKPVAEGRSDVVLKTNASSMDANDVHIQKLKDHGIFAQQGAGASHHIIVSSHHADKAKEILSGHLKEAKMVASADFKVSASGRKVHKLKKVGDDDYSKEKDLDNDGDNDQHDKDLAKGMKESVVPAHMQGKQKPYVSSDGKGNYEVLGNKGHTKATFTRAEHGKDAHKKAQDHLKAKYNEYMKEEVELEEKIEMFDEAVDKQEQRFIQLARLGLVDKANVSKLRMAIDQLKADKALTVPQRTLLLGVMMDLVDLVTGDDAVFQRVKMDVQKEDTQLDEGENKKMKSKDPCWSGYQMVGMKDKNGKKVPNCVPESTEEDPPFDKPYTTTKPNTTDKSGAQHTPMSRARHLAKLALAKQANKSKAK